MASIKPYSKEGKAIQAELLKYLRNEIHSIPHNLNNHHKNLTNIDLSNCQLKELKSNLFSNFESLHEINISTNQLTSLPHDLLNGLKNIDFINFSNNHIRELPTNLFSSVKTLVRIDFSHNNIEKLPENLFNELFKLDSVNFSYNSLKTLPGNLFNRFGKSDGASNFIDTIHFINFAHNEIITLPESLFNGLKSLFTVNFSNNRIHSLPENLFKDIYMVWEVNFSYNQIKLLPNNFFRGVSSCKSIHISNNHLKFFPSYIFTDIKTLKDVSISNNNINSISLLLLKNEALYIDIRNNFITNDVKNLFKILFTIDSSAETAEKSIIRKQNVKTLNEILLVLYLNKKCDETSLFSKDFKIKIDKLNDSKWSILDFLISVKGINEFVLIDLLLYGKKLLKENSYLKNVEFKMFSTETVEALCEINNLDLLKLALPVRNIDDSENPDDYNDFIVNQEFYFEINLCKCMEIVIEKNNEKMAIYLLNILNQIFELSPRNKKNKIRLNEERYKNVREFKENLLEIYLPTFFNDLNWFSAIENVLEVCSLRNFIEFLKYDDNTNQEIEIKQNQITQEPSKTANLDQPLKYESAKLEPIKRNIHSLDNELLVLIQNSNRANLLKHKTTKDLLTLKWKKLPRFSYYLTLLTYITFTVFYSITIELYKNSMTEIEQASIYICIALLIVFIFLEIFQVVHSFIARKLILYCSIFKNFCEIVNYPLCLITILIGFGEAKSILYSITIILTYVILITRLDKFYEIGPYVTVFGNVIVRSLRLIAILLISLIGFLLSFRNRGNYDFGSDPSVSNNMQVYNASFSLTLFRIFTFTAGQVQTDDMGLDEFNGNNFINFFIYGCFIIIMPILFLNVFTGISIDEISTLIERSEADNIATKIEYVYKFESIKHFSAELKRFKNSFKRRNYIKESITNYKNSIKQDELKPINQNESIEEKLNTILINLNQINNKFEVIEKRFNTEFQLVKQREESKFLLTLNHDL